MMFFDAVARKKIENQMGGLVAQYEEEKRLTLFPPGSLFLLFYVPCICVGIVCTVFLYSLAFMPVLGIDEGLNRLLMPMGISVLLILIVITGLLSLISGAAKIYPYLGMFSAVIFAMALLFCITYFFDLNTPTKTMHATAVLTLALSILLISTKKFYSFVSYFLAKKVLKKVIASKEKNKQA